MNPLTCVLPAQPFRQVVDVGRGLGIDDHLDGDVPVPEGRHQARAPAEYQQYRRY